MGKKRFNDCSKGVLFEQQLIFIEKHYVSKKGPLRITLSPAVAGEKDA